MPRAQPHRIDWPFDSTTAEKIDEMFQILFVDLKIATDPNTTGLNPAQVATRVALKL